MADFDESTDTPRTLIRGVLENQRVSNSVIRPTTRSHWAKNSRNESEKSINTSRILPRSSSKKRKAVSDTEAEIETPALSF